MEKLERDDSTAKWHYKGDRNTDRRRFNLLSGGNQGTPYLIFNNSNSPPDFPTKRK